jgi:outer membrane lipoprotein carrier protein
MDPLSCMLSFGLACAPSAPEPDPAVDAAVDAPTPPGEGAAAGSASETLGKVQKFYDQTADMKAGFTQTYLHPVYGTKEVSQGQVKVKRPGMMVWDYKKDSDPDFYADGNTLWVIERDTKQVITKDVRSSDFAGAVAFLFGGRKIVDDFFVRWAAAGLNKRYGRVDHRVVELKPKKKNPHYKRLLLVVDLPTGRVDSFVILNGDDSTNQFDLAGITTNNGLSSAAFKFKPPKNYMVIEE